MKSLNFLISIMIGLFFAGQVQDQTLAEVMQAAKKNLSGSYKSLNGVMGQFGMEICPSVIENFHNCMGANPSTPYVIPLYQAHPNEFLDASYPTLTEKTVNGVVYRTPNRIHPTEARVILMHMPKRSAYFGFQTYLFSKYGDPYIAIITSSDSQTIQDVTASLTAQGFPENRIFVESLGRDANMGMGENKNDYTALFRYAFPETEEAKSFYNAPPILTFRVVAKGRSNVQPLPQPTLDSRSGISEAGYSEGLRELVNRVKNKMALTNSQSINFINPINLGLDTFECDKSNTNCLGETRDTDTYLSSNPFLLGQDEVLVMGGVTHTLTGNGTYFSMVFNDADEIRPGEIMDLTGKVGTSVSQVSKVANFSESNRVLDLEGSADRVKKALKFSVSSNLSNQIDQLWIKIIVRDPAKCKGLQDCVVLSQDRISGVALDREVRVMRRVYIKPGTIRGPKPEFLLNPTLYKGN